MGRLGAVFLLVLAVLGCGQISFEAGAELPLAYAAEYKSANGTGLLFEHDDEVEGSPTALFVIPNFMPASDGRPAVSEALGHPLTDCSNQNYRCVQIGLNAVLTIPRRQLTPDAAFDFAGATFNVNCEDATCKSALITTACPFWERSDEAGAAFRCVTEDNGDVGKGRAVTYLFERDRGVVVYEASVACKPPLSTSACAD